MIPDAAASMTSCGHSSQFSPPVSAVYVAGGIGLQACAFAGMNAYSTVVQKTKLRWI
jgi:hypothetical protein